MVEVPREISLTLLTGTVPRFPTRNALSIASHPANTSRMPGIMYTPCGSWSQPRDRAFNATFWARSAIGATVAAHEGEERQRGVRGEGEDDERRPRDETRGEHGDRAPRDHQIRRQADGDRGDGGAPAGRAGSRHA